METGTVRLTGDEGMQNEVLHVFKDAVLAAIKSHDDGPGSDDSVEFVAGAKKRAAPSTPSASASATDGDDAPLHKKARTATGQGEQPKKKKRSVLPVLRLNLTFPAPNDSSALSAALSKRLSTAGHPTPLCPVFFHTARDNAKTPHRLYLRHSLSNAALVEFDPLDPAAKDITSGWTQWIAPPPVTKAGKPFKPRAKGAAKRAQRGEAKAVVATGAGGLLDALVLLNEIEGEGVKLATTLSASLAPRAGSPTPAAAAEDDDDVEIEINTPPQILFHLSLSVSIRPALFFPAPYSRSKRLLVDRILPLSPLLSLGGRSSDGAAPPKEAGIDFFYKCLERAPRTEKGLPVPRRDGAASASASASGAVTPALAMQVDGRSAAQGGEAEEDDEEERQARLRRLAKGKMRAVSPSPSLSADLDVAPSPPVAPTPKYEGPEDDPLFPPGLAVELMPFQARTVRWMLWREGKVVRPQPSGGSEDEEGEEGSGSGTGKGKEKDETEKQPKKPLLADISPSAMRDMRRGPLWEKVTLRALPRKADGPGAEGEEREVWLNRVSMALSEGDPLDAFAAATQAEGEKEGGGAVKGEDADGEVEILSGGPVGSSKDKGKGKALDLPKLEDDAVDAEPDVETHSSKTVVGGQEGHGLLAEEVGLGKTVEVLSLVLLHQDKKRRRLPSFFNPVTDSDVQPTGITLIIAPAAIVGQWAQEIARLAPKLRVLRYEGIKSLPESSTAAVIAKKYDIVLTTFDILRREVVFARKPAQRGLRNKREIRYRRSMLVEIDFLRVCMDEAQMVGDAVGPTSETASLISRRFSWAVTSTPLRDRISDLKPLLTFLRVEPIASGRNSLQRLLEEVGSFKRLWNDLGARTLKSQIQHELELPPQNRYIVPIDFTAVEKYYYDTRYREALAAVGLDEDGTPKDVGVDRETGEALRWEADKGEMNRWLTILRQLAVHPQLGGANREQLGRTLKTVEEVYAAMREQAVSAIQSDQRGLLAAKVRRGQYQMWVKEVEDRFEPALELFKGVVQDIEPIIEEVTKEIHEVWKKREKRKDNRSPSADPTDEGLAGALELGFRSDQQQQKDTAGGDGPDTVILTEKERAVNRTLGALRNRLRDLLLVKHSALFFSGHANFNMKKEKEEAEEYAKAEKLRQTILQPYENAVERAQAVFQDQLDARDEADGEFDVADMEMPFNEQGHGLRAIAVFDDVEATSDVANGYAELIAQYREMIIKMVLTSVSIAGENATGEEYEERAELQEKATIYIEAYTVLLGEWQYIVTGTRSQLADNYKADALAHLMRQEIIPEQNPPPKGVVPDKPVEDVDEAMQDAINAIVGPSRAKEKQQIDEDGEDEEQDEDVEMEDADGEYEDGGKKKKAPPKAKGKGKKKKEVKEKTRFQERRSANKKHLSYKDYVPPSLELGATAGEILRYELLVERLEAKGEGREFYEPQPLRHLTKSLNETAKEAKDEGNSKEVAILERERARLTKAIGPLDKVADRLRAEATDLDKAFNARILYYAQLQLISDEVADPDQGGKDWNGLETEIALLKSDEDDYLAAIEAKQTRRRYLETLNNPEEREEEERVCPICQEFFTSGVLTSCAHLTCADCFRRWRAHDNKCALCKTQLPAGSFQTVKYGPKAPIAGQEEEEEGPNGRHANSNGIVDGFEAPPPPLSSLDPSELDLIRGVETAAPLSSKSNFIAQHIKLLRQRDPEAKVVIFSAWQQALDLLMEAFTRNGVKFVRLEGATGKGKKEGIVKRFQEDPDVAAFFLHTRSQSAGLNLTVARYVFLVEPLMAPQLELQAVARVHRIGQHNTTIVHQYVVSDTVDERVAQLRARQGTSLFVADAQTDARKESFLGQQKDRASAEARKAAKTSDEAIDDEDDIAQCLLAPEAFLNLQRALLPHRLREGNPAGPSGSGVNGNAPQPAIRGERVEDVPAAMAGMAAAGRAASEAGEGAVASGSGEARG
ncbi:hypothetical protein JCM6882_001177 [Rhodosporidiobolus microsporus]